MMKKISSYFTLPLLLLFLLGDSTGTSAPLQEIAPNVPALVPGPDVIVGGLPSLIQAGNSGTQVGLAMATDTCNNGDVELNFFAMPNTDHTVMPQNLYRMSGGAANDERFEQIGQSWLKHAFFALQQNVCGFGCTPASGGNQLGVGCSNPDSASLNANQLSLGSRAWVNPYTGAFISTSNSHTGHTHSATAHRLLVEGSDLDTTLNPGATYYAEAQLVTPHEYAWCQANPGQCNMSNNVSYRQFSVAGTTSFTFLPVGDTVTMTPAINAWTGATIIPIEPAPGTDGRAFVASKVTGPIAGAWHYEYAIYNENLDRGIQTFTVPLGCGITVSDIGFHAPLNHPGFASDGTVGDAGYSNAAWTSNQTAGALSWSSETFAQNPNANAIRWGTLYNFRFDSNRPPQAVNATIGFFKTGTPMTAGVQGPAPDACTGATPTPSPTTTPPPTPSPTITPTPSPPINTPTPTPSDPGGSPTPPATPTATASPTPTATASPGPFDGFDPNANGGIRVVLVQPDGKILLGGEFTTLSPNGGASVARNHIARLNPDGSVDSAFNPSASSYVYTIALQADGKILVGGQFTSIGGETRNHIARLDATTGLADSWDPNANMAVNTIAVQADGKILVGGEFQADDSIGGQPRNRIARLDPVTGLADSFDPDANGSVYSIVIQADGRILVGGYFSEIGGQTRNYLGRLDAASGLADSFHPNANNFVADVALQADGKVLAGGQFTNIGGQARNSIARFDPTTGLADSFNPNANNIVDTIVVQADGKILAGGRFTNIGGQPRNRIARLDATTGLADSFDPNANLGTIDGAGGVAVPAGAPPPETPPSPTPTPTPPPDVLAIAVQADGKILAGGGFTTLAPNGGATVARNRIARLQPDGRLDQTLIADLEFSSHVTATAVQPDGKILIGGGFTTISGVPRNNIARLYPDGTVDLTFDPNPSNSVSSIVVQADGRILVGGSFSNIGGQARSCIARLDGTTGLADSFNPNSDGSVLAIAVQADGKILAVGVFDTIGGQTRQNIARLDPITGLADSFNPNASNLVSTIAVQPDGKILVGGQFTSIGGSARRYIARLDATTGLADTFNPSPNTGGILGGIALQTDGKILVSGDFFSIGGEFRDNVARLAPDGSADSFNAGQTFVGGVISFAVQANGAVVVGGSFTNIEGELRARVARLDAATGSPDSFNPIANDMVTSITMQADGKIFAGGYFTEMGGEPRSHIARLSNDTAALQNLAATQTTITWAHGGSSPQFTRVTFESSTDNVNYTPVGNGTATGTNWTLTGLNFPIGQNLYLRARGYYRTGHDNGSESIMESVRNAFFAGPAGTPTPTPPTITPTPTPPTITPTPTPTVTPGPTPPIQALNLSTRMRVQTGDNAGIGGFIITGTDSKNVLLRGIGPSLGTSGISDVLANPTLDLRDSNGVRILANNDWRDDPAQEALIKATGIPPTDDLEAAIVQTLAPGSYTVILRGMGMTSGVGLVEIYDLNQGVDSKLANLSTRAFIDTGNNIVIAGFILGGSGDDRIVVRGIGPSLTPLGVPNALPDPTLELRDGNGVLLMANNDWQDDPDQAAELAAAGLAPTNNLESGIARTLAPGLYTALLAGANNGTGVGLVEVYDRGPPP